MTPIRIGFVGFDGVTASHLTGPADAFAAAGLSDGFGNRLACYEIFLIGVSARSFRAESGMIFQAQEILRRAPTFDTIVIPGGSGLRAPSLNGEVSAWILQRASETRRIAAVCTGIYGLLSTGLLDGREITTHWRVAGDVARRAPSLRVNHKRLFVRDGKFYTSTGLTAGIDLAIALIEEDYGKHVSLAAAQEMVTPIIRRTVEKSPNESPVFDSQPIDRFADLVAWIVRNLHEDLSVEILARRACMCPRHFSRAFKSVFGNSPSDFVENLRLNEARRRLSTRRKTLQSVAISVGFRNADAFHRAYERRFGIRPSRMATLDVAEEIQDQSAAAKLAVAN